MPDPKSSSSDESAAETPPSAASKVEPAAALEPMDSVQTAGDRLRENEAQTWPVTEGDKLVGMIGEKNPDWAIGGRGHDPQSWKVGQIMSRELVFCYDDQDCATARQLMKDRDLRYLPVVDRQMRMVGIFTREEIEEKNQASASAAILPSHGN